MKALITGASSGMGRDMALYLSSLGYDLVIVARRENLLKELAKEINTKVEIEPLDISVEENCHKLYEKYPDIDFLVNNAGFGKYGIFTDINLYDEVNMINTNIVGLHVLTKLYVKEMKKRNKGYILNVASIAGLMPGGPLMTTYYATKSYVVSLTRGLAEELKMENSNVKVCALCPGPVNTEFNKVAKVQFSINGRESSFVAKYAIDNCLKGKRIIMPGWEIKMASFGAKLAPANITMKVVAKQQEKKSE